MVVALKYELPAPDESSKPTTHYRTSQPTTLSGTLKPGRASEGLYEFTGFDVVPPSNAINVEYRLVYRGKLGQEDDAIAVGPFKPVSGFLVYPNYAPADGLSGANEPRLIYSAQNQWRLSQDTSVNAGNIDWKGRYVAGKPTMGLSWKGPPGRYFPHFEYFEFATQRQRSYSNFGPEIYQGGEVFAVAPSNVFGASVVRDAQ